MALITVNALPSSGAVNPYDVYRWYQTNDLNYPYGTLTTPLDHGYWVVPYAGYSEGGVMQDGWLLFTLDYRDLPVGLLKKTIATSAAKGVVPYAKTVTASIESIFNGHVVPISTVSVQKSVQESHATITYVTSTELPIGYSYIKTLVTTPIATSIKSVTKTIAPSNPIAIDLTHIGKVVQSTNEIMCTATYTKALSIATSTILFGHKTPTLTATPELPVNLSHRTPVLVYSGSVDASIANTKTWVSSVESSVVKAIKLYASALPNSVVTSHSDRLISTSVEVPVVISKSETTVSSLEVAITVSKTPLYVVTTELPMGVGHPTKLSVSTLELPIYFAKSPALYVPSLPLQFTYSRAKIKYLTSNYLPIGVSASDKIWAYSNNDLIDIYGGTQAIEDNEQDWILIKKLGTSNWKFLSALDSKSTQLLAHIGAKIRLQETLAAYQNVDVTLTGFDEVSHIIFWKTQAKTEKIMEIDIEYVNQFPFRSTTVYFDWYNTDCYEIVQTFKQGPAGEIQPDTITEHLNFLPNDYLTITCSLSVTAGMAVYIDGSGIAQPALATGYPQANVVGIVSSKSAPTRARIAQSGEVGMITLPFAPGTKIFLSDTVPGSVTDTPPVAHSHVVRRLGYVTIAYTMIVDMQPILVVRA